MDTAKNQIVDIIKNNANILVTVSTNPSVDELSAALGLTILLDSLDKRATAVFSGAIPPAIQFLEPDKTFEATADSLRDFIIALDKDKADHLRYKVEGDVVKIFITPYKTALSQGDLEFSQGDYNVEVVLALGVKDQDHLDKALEAHGKILHDANVLTITAGAETSNLGSLDWHDGGASSLSEMIVGLADSLKEDKSLLDEQNSTALLTGIVSATDRFSNDRTSSRAMTVAAQLMAAGANQQLIAAKLEEAHDIAPGPVVDTRKDEPKEETKDSQSDTELSIKRSERASKPDESVEPASEPSTELDFEPTGDEISLQPEAQDAPSNEVKPEEPTEDANQQELEQKLADLNMSPIGTMADIEKELKEAADNTEGKDETTPSSSDTAAQDLILPALPQLPNEEPSSSVEGPKLDDQVTAEQPAPEIINEHGTFSEKPATESAPMNSIQSNPNEGEATVDPFSTSTPTVTVPPLTPTSDIGTPEGAAILASEPEPAAAPTTPTSDSVTIPQLPPLPPLPPDVSLPPLPPPPPPPTFDPAATTSPSGAVSGDIFGDGSTAAAQPAPPPAEPGQFKIPGQS